MTLNTALTWLAIILLACTEYFAVSAQLSLDETLASNAERQSKFNLSIAKIEYDSLARLEGKRQANGDDKTILK